MQRWATTLAGIAVVVLAVWLTVRDFRPPKPIGRQPPRLSAADEQRDGSRAQTFALNDSGTGTDDSGPLLLSDLIAGEFGRRVDAGSGGAMPDGTPVPALPVGVPREVRFGVVLISYSGAQPSVGGGRPASRSRSEAKGLAAKLFTTAEQDFHASVQQGDAGSSDDVGRVKLGILEPATEYLLFTLPTGGVAGPVDTPRGYWIVKRLE